MYSVVVNFLRSNVLFSCVFIVLVEVFRFCSVHSEAGFGLMWYE